MHFLVIIAFTTYNFAAICRLEQERRDHEMAVRLAKETNGHVEGSPPQLRRYDHCPILLECLLQMLVVGYQCWTVCVQFHTDILLVFLLPVWLFFKRKLRDERHCDYKGP